MEPNLYPDIEPYAHGLLDVGDGQRVYWEECGNPEGKPAVVLHGGPGSGCTPRWRRYFDPDAYRIILFDQRGCGRSTPNAGDPMVDLTTNTTPNLVSDIELLRRHRGVERWLVLGGSWGSTLALAYAQTLPARVLEMVLFAVVTTGRREVEWITRDIGRLFPAEWARFCDGAAQSDRDGNIVEAYSRLLADPDSAVRDQAALDWCNWEEVHVGTHGDDAPSPRYQDPAFRLCFARLVTHYWRHHGFLEDGALLSAATRLAGIPGLMIHGRLDISSPLDIPWRLARAWPASELLIVEDAGHGGATMETAVVSATDRFAHCPTG